MIFKRRWELLFRALLVHKRLVSRRVCRELLRNILYPGEWDSNTCVLLGKMYLVYLHSLAVIHIDQSFRNSYSEERQWLECRFLTVLDLVLLSEVVQKVGNLRLLFLSWAQKAEYIKWRSKNLNDLMSIFVRSIIDQCTNRKGKCRLACTQDPCVVALSTFTDYLDRYGGAPQFSLSFDDK